MKKRERLNVDTNDYSEETIRAKRKLPKKNIIILSILVVVQIGLILGAILYKEQPIDKITEYNLTVVPRSNGTLDIGYDVTWEPLTSSEALTWVDIGIANPDAEIYPYSISDTVENAEIVTTRDGGSYVRLYFKEEYFKGDVVRFSFEINQRSMLAKADGEYFYELVPGWFNEIPVESYCFSWDAEKVQNAPEGATLVDGFYVFEGSLEPGGYRLMRLDYSAERFNGDVVTVEYESFDSSGAYNGLDDQVVVIIVAILFVVCIGVAEVYLIDSFVSYSRGRGFITEKGHPVHTYGRTNAAYLAMHATHTSSGHRGGKGGSTGGRGCACACACACAGGGRAGCSAKARLPEGVESGADHLG